MAGYVDNMFGVDINFIFSDKVDAWEHKLQV